MAEIETRYCKQCNNLKKITYFYKSNNKTKYPSGYMDVCKDCITMMVDNWNPETYVWIMQEADIPYIPNEWDKLMRTYAKDPAKVTGGTIIGRYIAKMQLKQFRDYRWKDTSFLQELEMQKTEQAMKQQGYDIQDITTRLNNMEMSIPKEVAAPEPTPILDKSLLPPPAAPNSNYFDQVNGIAEEQIDIGLTDEEKLMLRLKWGKYYKPEEWVALEQLYNEFCQSYDIQTAGHIDTLKLICKTSLKANQLIDLGDIEGYQKMSRVYDQLMKSGRFTAAQNKAGTEGYIDSIAELVSLCEQEGFIPRYYANDPRDRVDEVLLDMKAYTRSLVTEEMNLGNLIEQAVKDMAREEAREDQEDIDEELNLEEIEQLRADEDYAELQDFIEEEGQEDDEILRQLMEGDF